MKWEDVRLFLLFVLVLLLIFVLVTGCTVGLVTATEKAQCQTLQAMTPDHEFQWAFWTGCMVKAPNGLWVHISSLQYNEVELEE